MATTLTFSQAPHGAYTTNESPIDGVAGNAVTVSNSAGTIGRYKLDDVPDTSALSEGNIGAVAATASFTPDVPGGYLVGFYDSSTGVRIAQLAFVVPEAEGYYLPPYGAYGDLKDARTGLITYGNFRPSGSTAFKTKGWKTLLPLLRRTVNRKIVEIDVSAGGLINPTADQTSADIIVATGTPPTNVILSLNNLTKCAPGHMWTVFNFTTKLLEFSYANAVTVYPNGSGMAWYDFANGQLNPITVDGGYLTLSVVANGTTTNVPASYRPGYCVLVDTTANSQTIALSPVFDGCRYVVKDKANAALHNITISPTSGLIDGAATKVINTAKRAYEFVADGTNLWLIGQF